jgi:hypothetical protein
VHRIDKNTTAKRSSAKMEEMVEVEPYIEKM